MSLSTIRGGTLRPIMARALLPALILGLLLAGPGWAGDPAPAARPMVTAQAASARQTIYHGNVRSKKFHRPSCRYYNCKNCTAVFKTREQAIRAGYVPCKVCRP